MNTKTEHDVDDLTLEFNRHEENFEEIKQEIKKSVEEKFGTDADFYFVVYSKKQEFAARSTFNFEDSEFLSSVLKHEQIHLKNVKQK